MAVEGKLAARVHGVKFVRDAEELFDQLRGASGSGITALHVLASSNLVVSSLHLSQQAWCGYP